MVWVVFWTLNSRPRGRDVARTPPVLLCVESGTNVVVDADRLTGLAVRAFRPRCVGGGDVLGKEDGGCDGWVVWDAAGRCGLWDGSDSKVLDPRREEGADGVGGRWREERGSRTRGRSLVRVSAPRIMPVGSGIVRESGSCVRTSISVPIAVVVMGSLVEGTMALFET